MIEIKTNQGQRIICPSNWNEVTAKQLIDIEKHDKRDIIGLFSILSGLDKGAISKDKTKGLERAVFVVIRFIWGKFNWKDLKHLNKFEYKGKFYNVPDKFDRLMLGQRILMSQLMLKKESLIDNMTKAVAIGMQPIIDGQWDEKQVDKLNKDFEKLNGVKIYALAKFFFTVSARSLNIGQNFLRKSQSRKTQMVRLQPDWLNRKDLKGSAILK